MCVGVLLEQYFVLYLKGFTDPPVIAQGPQGGSFLEEYDINLSCNVTANPPARIYWKKDGTFVEKLGNKYQVDYVKGTLFIPNAPKSAAGMYACYANNSRTCSSITLSVVSKEAEVKVEGTYFQFKIFIS